MNCTKTIRTALLVVLGAVKVSASDLKNISPCVSDSVSTVKKMCPQTFLAGPGKHKKSFSPTKGSLEIVWESDSDDEETYEAKMILQSPFKGDGSGGMTPASMDSTSLSESSDSASISSALEKSFDSSQEESLEEQEGELASFFADDALPYNPHCNKTVSWLLKEIGWTAKSSNKGDHNDPRVLGSKLPIISEDTWEDLEAFKGRNFELPMIKK